MCRFDSCRPSLQESGVRSQESVLKLTPDPRLLTSDKCLWPSGKVPASHAGQAGSTPARHSRGSANGKPPGSDPGIMKVRVLLPELSGVRSQESGVSNRSARLTPDR